MGGGVGWGDPASVKQLVCFANCCFNSCAEQGHKDSVQKATVEEQLKQRLVQLSVGAQLLLPPLHSSGPVRESRWTSWGCPS